MKKYFLCLLIIISTTLSIPVFAETQVNSGFIPGQIWYSKIDLVEGDTVNIHTAIWNGEKEILSAKVEFYDKNVILGSRDITLASLELKDVYVPWKITAGDHVISAKIISSQATVSGKKEKVDLDRVTTSNDRQFVSVLVKDFDGVPVNSTDSLLQN
jgi:outer membrane protein assembly factor BamB